MKYRFLLLLAFAILLACTTHHAKSKKADLAALRMELNRGVAQVVNLDTLICRTVYGAEGTVYFDDLLWNHLDSDTRSRIAQCLDQRKHLQVRAIPQDQSVQAWTARIDEDQLSLVIGWLHSDCVACDPDERVAVLRLEKMVGGKYTAHEIPTAEQWK